MWRKYSISERDPGQRSLNTVRRTALNPRGDKPIQSNNRPELLCADNSNIRLLVFLVRIFQPTNEVTTRPSTKTAMNHTHSTRGPILARTDTNQ